MVGTTDVHMYMQYIVRYSSYNSASFILIFSEANHLILNVHINTRIGKEMFHTSSMTSHCSKV